MGDLGLRSSLVLRDKEMHQVTEDTASSVTATPKWISLIVVALLTVTTVAAYAPTFHNGWTNYDDDDYVTANPQVQNGFTAEGWAWAWSTYDASNWHPLTWLSHMADAELFGPKDARGPHAVSLLIHLFVGILLYGLLAGTTGHWLPSALVAQLFLLHPLQVECVAWVSQRKTLIAMLMLLASLASYSAFVMRGRRRFYIIALVFYAASLLAKPMGVVLPLLLVLWDSWPLQRNILRGDRFGRLLEKLPFAGLAFVSCWVTLQAQEQAIASIDVLTLDIRAATAVVALPSYLAMFFGPYPLAVLYPHPLALPPMGVLTISLFVVVAVTGLAICLHRRLPFLLMGWGWFLCSLVPTLGLVQVGVQFVADRYMYLPSVGILVALVWSAWLLNARLVDNVRGFVAAGAVAGLLLGIITFQQVKVWRDSITLFENATAHTTGNYIAYSQLADAYMEAGREDEAGTAVQAAYDAGLRHPGTLRSLATFRAQEGKWEEAERLARQAVAADPEAVDLAATLAEILVARGKLDAAAAELRRARELDPTDPNVAYVQEILKRTQRRQQMIDQGSQ